MKKLVLALAFVFVAISMNFCTYQKEEIEAIVENEDTTVVAFCDTANLTYNGEIKTIIDKDCASSGCHEAGSPFKDYTTYSGIKAVITSGAFKNRVIDKNPSIMPVGGFPVGSDDEAKLLCWVEKGALEN